MTIPMGNTNFMLIFRTGMAVFFLVSAVVILVFPFGVFAQMDERMRIMIGIILFFYGLMRLTMSYFAWKNQRNSSDPHP